MTKDNTVYTDLAGMPDSSENLTQVIPSHEILTTTYGKSSIQINHINIDDFYTNGEYDPNNLYAEAFFNMHPEYMLFYLFVTTRDTAEASLLVDKIVEFGNEHVKDFSSSEKYLRSLFAQHWPNLSVEDLYLLDYLEYTRLAKLGLLPALENQPSQTNTELMSSIYRLLAYIKNVTSKKWPNGSSKVANQFYENGVDLIPSHTYEQGPDGALQLVIHSIRPEDFESHPDYAAAVFQLSDTNLLRYIWGKYPDIASALDIIKLIDDYAKGHVKDWVDPTAPFGASKGVWLRQEVETLWPRFNAFVFDAETGFDEKSLGNTATTAKTPNIPSKKAFGFPKITFPTAQLLKYLSNSFGYFHRDQIEKNLEQELAFAHMSTLYFALLEYKSALAENFSGYSVSQIDFLLSKIINSLPINILALKSHRSNLYYAREVTDFSTVSDSSIVTIPQAEEIAINICAEYGFAWARVFDNLSD